MDSIFGKKNFRNEIVWCYRGAGYPKKDFGKRHDIILRYSKTADYIFNLDQVREEYAEATKERFKHYIGNVRKGKDFGLQKLHPLGKQPDDWWEIQPIAPSARDRLGYPTQKPEPLLEKIIKASSNENGLILDPFAGCGTTTAVAERLKRKWIGIDITHLAINLIKWRMKHMFGLEPKKDYKVIGEPEDLAGAKELASQNRFQFQWWASSLIGAKPYGGKKKGADEGIDGYLYFMSEDKNKICRAIVSVKSGSVKAGDIRDLSGVMEREQAEMGIFVTLEKPTRPMTTEASQKGLYRSRLMNADYPRIQILTIEQILSGKKPNTPTLISTIKKAQPALNEQLPYL